MEDESNNVLLVLACSVFAWIFLHRWNQRNMKGPKTWPLVGAAIEQLTNYDNMHDWLVQYLSELKTVKVPMPFTEYTYIADPENDIDEKSLRDIVLNFVIAGRDTTAATLSWAIYMIMMHGDVAEKLYNELKAFEEDRAQEENVSLKCSQTEDPESFNLRMKQFAELVSYDSLGKLYYLHAVITETLRLYPAVPQDPKGVLKDDILPDGTKVKAGGMVTYVPYSMGRMEYNWGPDAAKFKPERWLKDGLFQNASPFKFISR